MRGPASRTIVQIYVLCSIIHNNQGLKIIQVSKKRWVDDEMVVYTMKYDSAMRKDDIMQLFLTWMELEDIMQCQVSQKEK